MWDQERFDWKQSVYRFRNFGYEYNYFFVVKPWIEIEYYSQRTLCIEPAHVTRPSDLKSYLNKMVNVATALGAERRVAEKELNETLNFELNLSMMASEPREDTNRFISISELQQTVPSIPWLEYLNSVLNLPHVTFPAPALMLLRVAPSYFSDLETLLFNTPKRIQANYLMWKVVESSIPFLTEEVQLDKSPFRWKKCVSLTSKSMPIVTGALYVRKHFTEGTKQDVMEMVSNIKKQFANTIKTADWMDNDTKQHALDKVAAMSSFVAYPDEFLSDEIFKDIYEGLHVMSDNFLKIILSITLYDYQDAAKRLVLPVKQPDWFEFGNVVNVNGHYVRQSNIIKLPAAILQGVFFSTDRPRYMNYGGIGFIIGHEITHGFDNTGRLYDKFGSLKDWWAPSANTKFIRKAQCLIDQYGNVSVPEFGLNLNGSLTQPENIADNGGVRNAYLAYNEWVRRNGKEPLLPNLNYTDRQLFWISAANAFCEKVLPRKELIQISRYPPTNFRINVALSNTDYFAKDFNCRIGSEMNPFKKCAVWKFLYI
ncbi:neprilysin-2-like isoform X2 [Photinus pyralis]|nr:neprilysin-2-like isoform X2 [Photinus pyralis]